VSPGSTERSSSSSDTTREAVRQADVKLVESHEHALSLEGTTPSGYGLGRAGWVNVPLHTKGVTLEILRDWIEESYRIVAPKRLVAELDRR
jgi:predicted DNA-binding protein (MmcQ/YjbR family)